MSEICDFSDLPVEACAHCKTGIETKAALNVAENEFCGPSRVFRAKCVNTCSGCGFAIEVDQRVYFTEHNRLVHLGC